METTTTNNVPQDEAANEARRAEITQHPDWFTNGPTKPQLLAEMRRRARAPEAVAAEDQQRAEVEPTTPANEKLRQEITAG